MVKISVVMSVYNAEKYLKEAIESILSQTFIEFEFIIINDGSTDTSLNIINSYQDNRIILINQINHGLSKSLNKGIEIAKSDLIARMDADDISLPERLKKQYDYMLKNPDCVVVGTNATLIDQHGNYLYKSKLELTDKQIKLELPESPFFHSSTIFRKMHFFGAKKYPDNIFHYFDDKILWNKLARFGKFANLEEGLIKYRLVPESISNLPQQKIIELRTVLNRIIENNFLFEDNDIKMIQAIAKTTKNKKFANYYRNIGSVYLHKIQILKALKNLLISFYYKPFERNTINKLIVCFIPYFLYKKLKERKSK